jgi:hypothetical protein
MNERTGFDAAAESEKNSFPLLFPAASSRFPTSIYDSRLEKQLFRSSLFQRFGTQLAFPESILDRTRWRQAKSRAQAHDPRLKFNRPIF